MYTLIELLFMKHFNGPPCSHYVGSNRDIVLLLLIILLLLIAPSNISGLLNCILIFYFNERFSNIFVNCCA